MHLSHTRYSVGLQRRIILEITVPSLWCRRSVTNIRFLMARKVLKATTASSKLRLGALSLGRDLENFSAHSRTTGRIRSQKEAYFWGPGQISGFSACRHCQSGSGCRCNCQRLGVRRTSSQILNLLIEKHAHAVVHPGAHALFGLFLSESAVQNPHSGHCIAHQIRQRARDR